jgi:hypothetical protein
MPRVSPVAVRHIRVMPSGNCLARPAAEPALGRSVLHRALQTRSWRCMSPQFVVAPRPWLAEALRRSSVALAGRPCVPKWAA